MSTYDLAVIGAGPGGYVAAIRASQLGMKTALIEAEELGGVCLNWGCIPTKALLKNASVLHGIRNSEHFGISVDNIRPDYGKAVDRSRAVVNKQVAGLAYLMKKNGITVIPGRGTLAGQGVVKISDGQVIEARHVILAAGARPKVLPGLVADGKVVFTAKEAAHLRELPARMAILGGGAIGCEFAYVFANYGVEVSLIELAEHLLPREEPEIAAVVERAYQKLGIKILTGHRVESASQSAEGVTLKLAGPNGPISLSVPRVLLGVGSAPSVEGLGLEELGVRLERGAVVVDEFYRTSLEGVYAIGDVTGKSMLAHAASRMGVVCVEAIAGRHPEPINFDLIPNCTYSEPQVASIGLSEAEARRRGLAVTIGKFPFAPNGKAQALGETEGLVKLVIDATHGEILGAHMVGPEVTELIAEVGLGMTLEATAAEFDLTIHAHPTLSEVVHEAALAALGQTIHL